MLLSASLLRYTNATSLCSLSSISTLLSSSSLFTSQIGEKRDRGFSPIPLVSVNSKDSLDQEKQSVEVEEKDLVQLVRMEVERSKAK